MINWKTKLINIIIMAILIAGLCFLGVNGDGQVGNINYDLPASTLRDAVEDEAPPVEEAEQKVTDLTVLLIDNINGSRITLRNCILQLMGEMQIAEDVFTYSNTFVDGNIYKITVLIELVDKEEELK